jgi:two-component system, OmpR family, sensor histidine kinase KdpD
VVEASARGRLKVFLGYAAGVGKTFQMLTEAHDLKRRGLDVVVGYFEPHGRKETIALIDGLEVIPRRVIEYRTPTFPARAARNAGKTSMCCSMPALTCSRR